MASETYGIISLLPALFAIVLTLVSRQVLLSLFAGIWIGATILVGWNPVTGAAHSLQLVIDNITGSFNSKLLLFTFLSGAMFGMIFLSGGMNALPKRIISRIRTRRQAELGTSILGMLIFADSYASTMITGSVMRPITDQFDISREKLAYLLDSTTSPVVSVAMGHTAGTSRLGQGLTSTLSVRMRRRSSRIATTTRFMLLNRRVVTCVGSLTIRHN
jgi:Na+/H+ antiporter NhaC